MSVVYFIQAGSDGAIKIGFAKNLANRLRSLRGGNAAPLRVLATVPGGRELEVRIHKALHKNRLRLEWFEPTTEIKALALLASVRGLPPVIRWLEQKESEISVPEIDFSETDDVLADIAELLVIGLKHSVARHGIKAVAEAAGKSRDRIEAMISGRASDLPFTSFIRLVELDRGSFMPLFARVGCEPVAIEPAEPIDAMRARLARISLRVVGA
jgi:hypothetical protein